MAWRLGWRFLYHAVISLLSQSRCIIINCVCWNSNRKSTVAWSDMWTTVYMEIQFGVEKDWELFLLLKSWCLIFLVILDLLLFDMLFSFLISAYVLCFHWLQIRFPANLYIQKIWVDTFIPDGIMLLEHSTWSRKAYPSCTAVYL